MSDKKTTSTRGPKLLAWSITWQETKLATYPPEQNVIAALEDLQAVMYAFQLERGEKNGSIHYQISAKFKSPVTSSQILKACKKATRCGKEESKVESRGFKGEWKYYAAGSITARPSRDANASTLYCLKDETRVEGTDPHLFPTDYYRGQDLLTYETMRPWQKQMYDTVIGTEPDDRAIHLIIDPLGGGGKSRWAKGLCYNHDAVLLPLGLSSAQMKSAIVDLGPRKLYIVDLPRNNKDWVKIFDTLEEIKRGHVVTPFNGRYKQLCMLRPHIVCFANDCPNLHLLSLDMWRIYSIDSSNFQLVAEEKMRILNHAKCVSKEEEKFSFGTLSNFKQPATNYTNSKEEIKDLIKAIKEGI